MDAVVVAAQLVTALQAIVSRNLSPTESGVITVGKIEGGCAPNVIASRVRHEAKGSRVAFLGQHGKGKKSVF